MNSKEQIPMPDESLEEIDVDATSSVDDFIKELEAKENELHITADLSIEIEDSELDPRNTTDFIPPEIAAPPPPASTRNAQAVGAKTRIYELEQEIEALKGRLTNMRGERNEVQEKSDRRLRDFENYKYRMDRERRGAFIDQITNLASQMLPVLDNLDRALISVESPTVKKGGDFQQFYDGIGLVNQQVNEIFSAMGVQPIETVGELFDPNFHEAVAVEETTDIAPNTILNEMLRGYRIGNRVIRHSMVKVTTAPPAKSKVAEDVSADAPNAEAETPSAVVSDPNEILPDLNELLSERSDAPARQALLPEVE